MLQSGVSGQDRVVWFDYGRRDLGSGVDRELQLRSLAVLHAEALHQQGREAGARAASKRVEDEEALQARAHLREAAHSLHHHVNHFLSHSVVAASVVVGSVLLAGNQLLRVEQLTIGASANFVCRRKARMQAGASASGPMAQGLPKRTTDREARGSIPIQCTLEKIP